MMLFNKVKLTWNQFYFSKAGIIGEWEWAKALPVYQKLFSFTNDILDINLG